MEPMLIPQKASTPARSFPIERVSRKTPNNARIDMFLGSGPPFTFLMGHQLRCHYRQRRDRRPHSKAFVDWLLLSVPYRSRSSIPDWSVYGLGNWELQ